MTQDFTLRVRPLQFTPDFRAYDVNVDGEAPWPFRDRKHCFTAPDGPDAHDHPFDIHVFIPPFCPPDCGGYVEEIFTPPRSMPGQPPLHLRRPDPEAPEPFDFGWNSRFVTRNPGDSFLIPARRVHRVHSLLRSACWTIAVTGHSPHPDHRWRVFPHHEIRNLPAPLD